MYWCGIFFQFSCNAVDESGLSHSWLPHENDVVSFHTAKHSYSPFYLLFPSDHIWFYAPSHVYGIHDSVEWRLLFLGVVVIVNEVVVVVVFIV